MSEEEDLKYLQTEYEENIIGELVKENEQLQNQLQQKENIIKEVREYILKEDEWVKNSDYRLLKTERLLEILDKGE